MNTDIEKFVPFNTHHYISDDNHSRVYNHGISHPDFSYLDVHHDTTYHHKKPFQIHGWGGYPYWWYWLTYYPTYYFYDNIYYYYYDPEYGTIIYSTQLPYEYGYSELPKSYETLSPSQEITNDDYEYMQGNKSTHDEYNNIYLIIILLIIIIGYYMVL